MLKTNMPHAEFTVRPNMEFVVSPKAIKSYTPVMARDDKTDENTISILDFIGEDFMGEGVTSKRIHAALRRIGDNPVNVLVNSPGGSYFEGLAIYNLLREHKQKVTVEIVGLAASAASVIAMAGDEIKIARAGFIMIHNTWLVSVGDRHDLRELSDTMEMFDEVASEIYAAKTGHSMADVATMMDRETWLSGKAATDQGFADSNLDSDAKVSQVYEQPIMNRLRQIDAKLAKAGIPRNERRDMFREIKQDTQDAALQGKQDAAFDDVGKRLLTLAENL